jgi:hypothetical protein
MPRLRRPGFASQLMMLQRGFFFYGVKPY